MDIVIVAAKRTPMGAFQGALSALSAPELGACAIRAALAAAGIDATRVDEVYLGNVLSAGVGQAPAHQAAIKAGQFKPGLMIGGGVDAIYTAALEAGVITRDEHATAMRRGMLRDKVIRVDDFPYDFELKAALCDMPDSSPLSKART